MLAQRILLLIKKDFSSVNIPVFMLLLLMHLINKSHTQHNTAYHDADKENQ